MIENANGHDRNGHDRLEVARRNSEAIGGFYAAAAAASGAVDKHFAQQMNDVHASYFAGTTSRFLPRPPGINPMGSSADYHYASELAYFLAVERARFDDRDNMVIGQGVNRFVANVVQTGFTNLIRTGDTGVDDELKARWDRWAESPDECDYDGERSFEQISRGILRNRTVDGDIFSLPTSDGKLQVIENHHCRNPFGQRTKLVGGSGLVHGVELRNNKRVAYHFTPEDLSPGAMVSKRTRMRRIPARDKNGNRQVFHVYDPRRFSQRRGVTAFAPIVFPTRYHDDLQFAAMVNAKKSGFIAIVHEMSADAPTLPGRDDVQSGSRVQSTREDGTTQTEEGGSPGQTFRSKTPGETIRPWFSNIPAPSFFDHANLLLGILSINLDLPVMVFTLDASATNFNGYRGVIDQSRLRFSQIQNDLITQSNTPVYQWKVRQFLAEDPFLRRAASRSGINVFGHIWTPRGWPYIQPVQDAAADDLRLSKNLISARRRAQERGIADFDQMQTEIVQDRASLVLKALEASEEINKQYPESKVTWRDLAYGGDTAVKVSLSGNLDGETEPEPEPKPAKEKGTNGKTE